jgi:hypothetical protein
MVELEALGMPAFLVVPSALHRMDLCAHAPSMRLPKTRPTRAASRAAIRAENPPTPPAARTA